MKKILITGAHGFIGSHIYDGLKDNFDIVRADLDSIDLLDIQSVNHLVKKILSMQ